MGLQKLISGNEFCRKNRGKISHKRFYEEYYRILHTAYLNAGECSCIEIIKEECENTFGITPDSSSLTFILATAKYLADDDVISELLGDGVLESKYNFQRLAIEIGFDVWLLTGLDKKRKFKKKDFYQWLPLSKSERTELAVKEFWNLRLPKTKNYKYLYERLLPYRTSILECYRKLLLKNHYPEDDREALNRILHYLDEELPAECPYTQEMAKTVESCMQETAPEEVPLSEQLNASEEIPHSKQENPVMNEPVFNTDEILLDSILEVDEAAEDVSVPAIDPVKKTFELNHWEYPKNTHKNIQNKTQSGTEQKSRSNISAASTRGFCCDKRILTKEKLQTAAKCVVIAGVCLVPLITYQCLKKR